MKYLLPPGSALPWLLSIVGLGDTTIDTLGSPKVNVSVTYINKNNPTISGSGAATVNTANENNDKDTISSSSTNTGENMNTN